MITAFTDHAWLEYVYWQENDPEVLVKINELIKEIKRDPFKRKRKAWTAKREFSRLLVQKNKWGASISLQSFGDGRHAKCNYYSSKISLLDSFWEVIVRYCYLPSSNTRGTVRTPLLLDWASKPTLKKSYWFILLFQPFSQTQKSVSSNRTCVRIDFSSFIKVNLLYYWFNSFSPGFLLVEIMIYKRWIGTAGIAAGIYCMKMKK